MALPEVVEDWLKGRLALLALVDRQRPDTEPLSHADLIAHQREQQADQDRRPRSRSSFVAMK